MPKQIRKLTDEQRAAIPDHVAKWIEIGWCTDEADWAQFEEGPHGKRKWAGEWRRVAD